MKRSKGKKSVYIKGPIGKGTPFKMVRNDDGSPNYVVSVQQQREAARHTHIKPSVKKAHAENRGKEYVSEYVSQLRSSIANIQRKMGKENSIQNVPNRDIQKNRAIQSPAINKNPPVKQPVKNAPTIKR